MYRISLRRFSPRIGTACGKKCDSGATHSPTARRDFGANKKEKELQFKEKELELESMKENSWNEEKDSSEKFNVRMNQLHMTLKERENELDSLKSSSSQQIHQLEISLQQKVSEIVSMKSSHAQEISSIQTRIIGLEQMKIDLTTEKENSEDQRKEIATLVSARESDKINFDSKVLSIEEDFMKAF